MQCRDCKATFSKAELLAEHTEKEHNKKLESYGMVPVKRGRGRPPKHSYVNVGYYPAQDLTHIRPPAKRERTFYSSDEEDGKHLFFFYLLVSNKAKKFRVNMLPGYSVAAQARKSDEEYQILNGFCSF